MKGRFVTLEGVDGAGKSTQLELLEQHLRARGVPYRLLREPGSTPVGEEIRRVLLHSAGQMLPFTEVLLYAAARAQLVAQEIVPALGQGLLVVCDRYVDSTAAYQGYGGGVEIERVGAINEWATGGLRPDLTILFDIDPVQARARQGGAPDRMERKDAAFHARVREGYLRLAGVEPDRFRVIDASRPVADVQAEVRRAVEELLDAAR